MSGTIPKTKALSKEWKPLSDKKKPLADNLNELNKAINNFEVYNGSIGRKPDGGIRIICGGQSILLPWTFAKKTDNSIVIALGTIDGNVPTIGGVPMNGDAGADPVVPVPALTITTSGIVYVRCDLVTPAYTIHNAASLPPDSIVDQLFHIPIGIVQLTASKITYALSIKNFHLNLIQLCDGKMKTSPAG